VTSAAINVVAFVEKSAIWKACCIWH